MRNLVNILCIFVIIAGVVGVYHAPTISGVVAGKWSYECDELGFKRYSWTNTIQFDHEEMVVQADFDDWDYPNSPTSLAFRIYSPKPGFEYDWLYVHSDGSLDPELTYFNEFGPMEEYPGGYAEFEKELIGKKINWTATYQLVRAEFLVMYFFNNGECLPHFESGGKSG